MDVVLLEPNRFCEQLLMALGITPDHSKTGSCRTLPGALSHSDDLTQRLHYPLIKEYTSNYDRSPNMI